MALPSIDQGLSKGLFIHKIREEDALNFYLKNLKKSDSVIDCGANLGYFVIHAAKKTKFVYAIEPLKEGLPFIGLNCFLNNIENFSLFNLAMGDKNKRINFFKSDSFNKSKPGRVVSKKDSYNYELRKIYMKKLDAFIKENNIKANILRMDIEGFELEVLKGAKKFLKQKNAFLFIEVHPDKLNRNGPKYLSEKTIEDFCKILHDSGFNNFYISNNNKKFEKDGFFEKIKFDDMVNRFKGEIENKGFCFHLFCKK